MKRLAGLITAAMLSAMPAQASEASDALADHLYGGTAAEGIGLANAECEAFFQESCFAAGMLGLVLAYDGLAQDLYRYGATSPADTPASLLFGIGTGGGGKPANPDPEKLTYPQLRLVLEDFLADLDKAGHAFELAGAAGDYVLPIDPFQVRIDFDGDGTADAGESLGALLEMAQLSVDEVAAGGKIKDKGQAAAPDTTIGFDRADAVWFAGYSQVAAAPIDLVLAHDFSDFYNAYLHRIFPRAGLPMQDHGQGGIMFFDPEGDAGIADLIAGIHTLDFPVTDAPRLAGVLERLKAITTYSRHNWTLILEETDDDHELVPSPTQTSLMPGMVITQQTVDAWMATLDTVDNVLDGALLVPHWRFTQGFDLKAYFTTATETDLVMLIAGQGALPFLRPGPIADAQSFAAASEAFGAEWLNYAFWFN